MVTRHGYAESMAKPLESWQGADCGTETEYSVPASAGRDADAPVRVHHHSSIDPALALAMAVILGILK